MIENKPFVCRLVIKVIEQRTYIESLLRAQLFHATGIDANVGLELICGTACRRPLGMFLETANGAE